MPVRIRLLIAYEGSDYHGFANQPGVATVAGELIEGLQKILGHEIELVCAGRTDTGVHAWGQVVHFDTYATEINLEELQRSMNHMLPSTIVIREAVVAEPSFDARHSATERRYRYSIVNRVVPDPFLARTHWHIEEPLDVRSMQLACDPLIGEHDFSSFCRRPDAEASLVRRVHSADWIELGDGLLSFDVRASSFCHQMVRSLVGTLVEMGLGRKKAGDMAAIMRSRDRHTAGQLAPPHGLCLWEVEYK